MNWVWNAFVEIGTHPWKRTPIISVNLVILDELLRCYLLGVLLGLRGYGIIQSFDESSWTMTMFFHFYLCGWWFGTFFDFPYIGNSHPNWLSYFSEGLKPPTSYFWRWLFQWSLFHHPIPSGGKAMSSSKVFAVGKELFIVFALKWDPADRRKNWMPFIIFLMG